MCRFDFCFSFCIFVLSDANTRICDSILFLLAACVVGKSRIHIYLFTVMIALLGSYYWKYNQYNACEEWLRCKMYYNIGAFRLAKEGYEKIYPELNDRGDFCLSMVILYIS